MDSTSRPRRPKHRDIAYYRQRQKNRVLALLVEFFADEAARNGTTKKEWAEAAGKDAAQVTKWTTSPTNLELDTISDLLLPFGAEMDHRIVRFVDRPKANLVHPLMRVRLQGASSPGSTTTTESTLLTGTTAPPKTAVKAVILAAGV